MSTSLEPEVQGGTGRLTALSSVRFRPLGIFRDFPLLAPLIVTIIVGTLVSPHFLTTQNIIFNILEQNAPLGIVVVGEVFLLIAFKLDLSLESTVGLVPMIGAWLVVPATSFGSGFGVGPWIAIAAMVLLALLIGTINGILVVRLGLNSFIITIAGLIVLRGISLGVSNGVSMSHLPNQLAYLGSSQWLGIPAAVWIAGVLFVGGELILTYHRVGREIYALGGNIEAARAAGVRVDRLTFALFIMASLLAALAGVIIMGRIGAVASAQGQNMIFAVMAASVLGGVDMNGGRGRLTGALLGVLFLGTVSNILLIAGVPVFWLDATNGALILAALLVARVAGGRR